MLSNSQIDNICRRAANLSHEWEWDLPPVSAILDSYLIDFFLNLYTTGLRFHELQTASRWRISPTETFICDTLKNSNDREFTSSELTSYFTLCISDEVDPYPMCRYSTVQRWFKRVVHPYNISFDTGGLSSHIFRHNKCKQMYENHFTLQQISDYLGEVDNNNTSGYISSEIYA